MSNCVICLNNSSNRICPTCRCHMCPSCWGTYLQKTRSCTTFLVEDNRGPNDGPRILFAYPISAECPQCRGTIPVKKPVTRTDTRFCREQVLQRDCLRHIEDLKDAEGRAEEEDIMHNIFLGLAKDFALVDPESKDVLRTKLHELYYEFGWGPANQYHLSLFGEQVN